MKKLFMTLIAAASMLAIGCTKDENAVTDEENTAKMIGVWKLDLIKVNNDTIAPENYVQYVEEEYLDEYQQLIALYNNIIFTFREDNTGEVFGEEFEWQMRENNEMAIWRDGVTIIEGNDTIHSDDYEIPYDVLSLSETEALFQGFIFPMPHFRFPGAVITCHMTRMGDVPDTKK